MAVRLLTTVFQSLPISRGLMTTCSIWASRVSTRPSQNCLKFRLALNTVGVLILTGWPSKPRENGLSSAPPVSSRWQLAQDRLPLTDRRFSLNNWRPSSTVAAFSSGTGGSGLSGSSSGAATTGRTTAKPSAQGDRRGEREVGWLKRSFLGRQLLVGHQAGVPGLHQLSEVIGSHGFAEQETLTLLTAVGFEKFQLLKRLDAFGNDVQVQALAQADDGADQLRILAVFAQAAHEGLIDLQHIDGKPSQVTEAGITGAEIVDGQPHTQGLDVSQGDERVLDVLHQHALGDFQFKQTGRQARALQNSRQVGDKIALAKINRRNIHRDTQRRQAGGAPGLRLLAGLAQHPLAQGHDQAAVFGHGNEG